jgi:DNA-binding NarL/FixJ family response regulator
MDVLAIPDQPLTVLALRSMLRQVSPASDVFDASHLGEAMAMLGKGEHFGMIVLDLDTHGVRGPGTPALLRQMWPSVPLVLLASRECDVSIVRAVELGVSGYVLKTASTEELQRACSILLAGGIYVPEPVLETT